VRLLAVTYAALVEGQTRELQLTDSLDHGLEGYMRVIGGKTASLIRTSARLGAIAADANPESVDALTTWANELGLVFQMADDALDLVATEDSIGKPAGSDVREGKFTLPLLLAVEGPDGDRLRRLLGRHRPYPDDVVDEVLSLVRAGGWVDQVIQNALERMNGARNLLAKLPDIEARSVLERLAGYLVERVESRS
jgi:geranylgeranyl pyrophosphate synthase